MDIKIAGVTPEIMRDALAKANVARNKILEIMEQAIPAPRKDLSEYAPRITSIRIDKEKIREIIGPGGKIVRDIQETTGTTIVIEDDGTVQVAASNKAQRNAALKRIKDIVAEPEMGAIYEATVKSIVDFGAFVEFLPGKEGLVHISELDLKRVNRSRGRGQNGRCRTRQAHRLRPVRQGQVEQKSAPHAGPRINIVVRTVETQPRYVSTSANVRVQCF